MERVKRFIDWREPIKEAYFPKLNRQVTGRVWPARVADQKIQNISRTDEQLYLDVDDLIIWKDRIFGAINTGFVINVRFE